jgi:hypothetical protein
MIIGLAAIAPINLAAAAEICEQGKGYVAADISEQVTEEFLRGLKEAGIGTVIRCPCIGFNVNPI